ncbi:MAG: type VI secretion system baseplate subunit TssF [Planctomycetes bacterium]|nr:type VI secretion system baseplate subunit TssF [Planctomycetota bacterium]
MDPRLLDAYNQELQHVREMGAEFAKAFPKIAGRLGLEGFECADPYVERLLEGFAFLSARVQVELDSEFPQFTQHLMEIVYPHYLAPVPSMAIAQLRPDLTEGGLAEGFDVPRGSVLRSTLGKGEQTPCEYRTAHDLTLWPLEIVEAEYHPRRDLARLELPETTAWSRDPQAAIRIRLRTTAGLTFDELSLDRLSIHLRAGDRVPHHLYEQIVGHRVGVAVRPTTRPAPFRVALPSTAIRGRGFDDGDALLPPTHRSFNGYRLLTEYFTFPERFLFFDVDGLGRAVHRHSGQELDVLVLVDRVDPFLENAVQADHFALYATPAINLFPRRADRVHIKDQQTEFHVVVDRTRPIDFEVHTVTGVTGVGTSSDDEQPFRPFYGCRDARLEEEHPAYYTITRRPRRKSVGSRRAPRSSYLGGEVYLSLVDGRAAPHRTDLRQLSVSTLCTNRDLPLLMSVGQGRTDFTMESGAPVESVRCLGRPTRPFPSHVRGETAWRLVSHLSLNYLSLIERADDGASPLRELLSLYTHSSRSDIRKQIEGVRGVECRSVMRRVGREGPLAFGRGLEIELLCDELQFEGSGVFLMGAVLDEFFARHASINSFTETVLVTPDRGEVMRWPIRTGRRPIL